MDDLCNTYLGRQIREIDASPFLLLAFGSLVVLKYVGRETGDGSLQFIGGCLMVVMLFARYFFRGAKRTKL